MFEAGSAITVCLEPDAAVLAAAASRWREFGEQDEEPATGPPREGQTVFHLCGRQDRRLQKLKERSRNFYENKGPLWKTRGLSWNVVENTCT